MRQFALLATIATFAIWAAPAPATPSATAVAAAPALERTVLEEVNALRGKLGLGSLQVADGLDAAAVAHGRSMLIEGFFSHDSPDGASSWERIERFYPQTSGWRVGENLLWSVGRPHARRVVRAWLDSPPHRAVLLSSVWREIGIAALTARRAPGFFGGRTVTVVVADFGAR